MFHSPFGARQFEKSSIMQKKIPNPYFIALRTGLEYGYPNLHYITVTTHNSSANCNCNLAKRTHFLSCSSSKNCFKTMFRDAAAASYTLCNW